MIFWPVILYILTFIIYCLIVNDFYSKNTGIYTSELFIPAFIGCYFVLPALGIFQLVYGVTKMISNKSRNYRLHIYSSMAVFCMLGIFMLSLAGSNYPTV